MGLLDFLPVVGPLVEGAVNMFGQASTNQANKDMMNTQRTWAVQDWDKQNAYNAPSAQMQRYKDAGLNPNLIYGNGASSAGIASPIRQTETAKQQPVNTGGNVADSMLKGFLSMYDLQKTQAETDRLKKQAELIEAERRLKEQSTQNLSFDLYKGQQTLPLSLEGMGLKNRNLAADLPIKETIATNMVQDNARKWLLAGNSLSETAQRILESQARTANLGLDQGLIHQKIEQLKKSNTLSDLDIQLKQKGLSWSDPYYMRIGSRLIDKYLKDGDLPFVDHAGQSVDVGNSPTHWHFRKNQ
ncbi:MAG: DNA pilot protein [Microvirus sp.]|nr:MAG: DNA pilot protein [Microvirus sp.]